MAYRISSDELDALGFDLASAVGAYQTAREAHKLTEGVPAPTAHPVVEDIVRRHGGQFEVLPIKEFVRIVDGVIVDRRRLVGKPADLEWVERTDAMQNVGNYWDPDAAAWTKRGAKETRLDRIEAELVELRRLVEDLAARVPSA